MERMLTFESPLGPMTLSADTDGQALVALSWRAPRGAMPPVETPTPVKLVEGDGVLPEAARQIAQYFSGTRTGFDVPLAPDGSDLQRAVCAEMAAIPFGETRSYGDLARALGVPAQAIGQACGGNPIPIVIPCHRVLVSSGLGGFSGGGGIDAKVWLLRHEGAAGLLI